MTTGEQAVAVTTPGGPLPETTRSPMPSAAPGVALVWWLLAAWLAVNLFACLAYVVWVAPLGFGGIIYLLLGIPVVEAGFGFGVLWMCLGHDTRLARFADLPMGIAALAIVVARSLQDDFSSCWPILQFLVAVSLPLVLLRHRGFCITTLPAPAGISPAWWRFGIADLLLMTTCLGVLLGLVSLSDQPLRESALLLGFAVPTWFAAIFGFGGRKAFRGYLASVFLFILFGAVLLFGDPIIGDWLPEFFGIDLRISLMVDAVQSIPLMAAVGLLRWRGFRLRNVGAAGAETAAQKALIR